MKRSEIEAGKDYCVSGYREDWYQHGAYGVTKVHVLDAGQWHEAYRGWRSKGDKPTFAVINDETHKMPWYIKPGYSAGQKNGVLCVREGSGGTKVYFVQVLNQIKCEWEEGAAKVTEYTELQRTYARERDAAYEAQKALAERANTELAKLGIPGKLDTTYPRWGGRIITIDSTTVEGILQKLKETA